jgi:iron complex outermembrane receptor protein
MSFIGGVFAIRKPYFNINTRNFYEQFGEEERRGVELSLTGQLAPRLNVVAGAVWMGPRVSVARSEAVDVGPRAVGANDRIIELSADYGLKSWPAASIDCSYWNFGSRVASLDNRVRLGGTTSLDVGARYRLKLRGAPATVRVLLQNITNTFSWELTESAGLSPYSPRSAQVYITLDI